MFYSTLNYHRSSPLLHSEERLFHIEGIDDEEDRFQDAQTMAHELAHQFFGNLVTSDWWSDFWFNEGFCGIYEIDLVKEVICTPIYYINIYIYICFTPN